MTVIEQRVVEEVQLSSKDIENKTNARLGEVQGVSYNTNSMSGVDLPIPTV